MPPGYVSLPNDVTLDWCEQLVSEEYTTHKTKRTNKQVATWQTVKGGRGEALDCHNYARAMAGMIGWSHWSDADYLREEAALQAHADKLRREMAVLQSKRLARGDARPVMPEDLVSNIVRPSGFRMPEPEASIVLPAAPAGIVVDPTQPTRPGATPLPRGLRDSMAQEGAVERPDEVGVAGKASQEVDFRSLMKGAGMGRGSNEYDP